MKLIWLQLALGLFQADLAVKHEIDTDENEEKRPERELGMAGGRFSGHMSSIIKFSGIMTLAGMVRFLSLLPQNGRKLQKAGYALLTGGALSNLYDRCKKGYVVDYVSFRTPFQRLNRLVFNLSDFFIMAGALLICFGQTEKTRG